MIYYTANGHIKRMLKVKQIARAVNIFTTIGVSGLFWLGINIKFILYSNQVHNNPP